MTPVDDQQLVTEAAGGMRAAGLPSLASWIEENGPDENPGLWSRDGADGVVSAILDAHLDQYRDEVEQVLAGVADGNVAEAVSELRRAGHEPAAEFVEAERPSLQEAGADLAIQDLVDRHLDEYRRQVEDHVRPLVEGVLDGADRFGWVTADQRARLIEALGASWEDALGDRLDEYWSAGWEVEFDDDAKSSALDDLIPVLAAGGATGTWQDLLDGLGTWNHWDGSEERWEQLRDWFLGEAYEHGTEAYELAYEHLDPLNGMTDADRLAALASMGIEVVAVPAEDAEQSAADELVAAGLSQDEVQAVGDLVAEVHTAAMDALHADLPALAQELGMSEEELAEVVRGIPPEQFSEVLVAGMAGTG